jgi:hypothetical protein
MDATCHRCHGVVIEGTAYCPHCGAPQLTMNSYAQPLAAPGEAAEAPAATQAGTRPRAGGFSSIIDWHVAVVVALLAAGVSAVLMSLSTVLPFAGVLSLCWWISAAMFSVTMYHRRSPQSLLNGKIGARIGSLVGLMLAVVYVLFNAVVCVLDRFVLHHDFLDITEMTSSYVKAIGVYKNSGQFDAQSLAQMQQTLTYWLTPTGRATYILMLMAMFTGFTLAFCLVMGAISGRLVVGRRKTA